ncbi:hypothetical protein Tco_1355632, partial [Tanacetum coccineum]
GWDYLVKNLIFGSAFLIAAMNSDLHDDSAIVACFCVLQLIGDSP